MYNKEKTTERNVNNIELISKVLQYIDDHISEDISFKTLADIYGYGDG